MPKIKNGRLRSHLAKYRYEWLLFIGFFLFNAVIATQFKSPVSYPDEHGVLMAARHIYGGESWRGSASYYGYSSILLIGWLFLIFEDIRHIYVGVLMVQSVLIALVPVLCYKLLNEVLKVEKASVKLLLSMAVSLYPSLTLYSKFARNETMLTIALFGCFYLIGKCTACEDKRKLRIYSALLGFFPVLAYASHGMGLAHIVAVFMIVFVSHILSKKKLVSYPAFLASFAVFFFADSKIKAYLMEFVFKGAEGDLRNTFMYSLKRMIKTALNTDGLKTFFRAIVSKAHYVSTATFGLFLLLSVILHIFIFLYFKKRFSSKKELRKAFAPEPLERTEVTLAVFAFFILLCGVVLSTLNHISAIQLRQGTYYFYARYYEYMVLPLILFGLYYVFTKEITLKKLLLSSGASAGIYVALAIFTQLFVVPYVIQEGAETKRNTIYGVLPYIGSSIAELRNAGTQIIVEYNVILMGIAGLGGLIVMTVLLAKKFHKTVVILLAAMFLYGSFFGLLAGALPMTNMNYDRYYAKLESMRSDFSEVDDVYEEFPTLYVLNDKTLGGSYRIQLAFNRYVVKGNITFDKWQETENPGEKFNNAIIISDKDFELEVIDPAYLKILSTENTTVWIRGNEIHDYWANRQSEKSLSASAPENPGEKFNNAIIVYDKDFELEVPDPAYLKILGTENTTVWICTDEIHDYWTSRQSEKSLSVP